MFTTVRLLGGAEGAVGERKEVSHWHQLQEWDHFSLIFLIMYIITSSIDINTFCWRRQPEW